MKEEGNQCHSIESYIAVLLAWEKLENETDCLGLLHWIDWEHSIESGHPTQFEAANISTGFIREIRFLTCFPEQAIR